MTNITKITRLAIPGFWSNARAAWKTGFTPWKQVFPIKWCHKGAQKWSSLVENFERAHDVTWWEKLFHGARALDQNPGIANLCLWLTLFVIFEVFELFCGSNHHPFDAVKIFFKKFVKNKNDATNQWNPKNSFVYILHFYFGWMLVLGCSDDCRVVFGVKILCLGAFLT